MYPNYINKPSFMNNSANTSFGATPSTFGQPAANTSMFQPMQPSNIFQSAGTSTFSSTPSQSGFGTNLFGQQPQPSTSGLFGSTNAFNQNKSFGFGSTPGQSGLFGQQPQQQAGSSLFQPNSSMLFGNNSFGNQTTGTVIKFNPPTGTDTMQKNGVTQSISTKHHSISCMKEYENKSYEELRFEDYSANRKGPQQTGFGSTPFGAPPTTTPSIFGQTDNKPVFGQPQAFGQTSAFGQTTPAFGATNPTSTPNLFGKPNTFGTTSTTPGFGFNPTPATNPFSSNQTQKPFSQPLFGTATTQAQSTFGTGVFGQTNTQNTTSNLFQKPAQPTTGFNTGQSGFSFNQPGTTQSSNLFQVSKPNTGFGLFGQTSTGTTGFGQTSQPAFGPNFGKLTTSTFAQPTQAPFGTNLTCMMLTQPQPLFGNTATKPPSLFGSTTTGGSNLFSNNFLQQNPPSFSLNVSQQQQAQFPPEPSDEIKNISLLVTDSFPDGPHMYGLEPKLGVSSSNTTTNPRDIKAILDFSKKQNESVGALPKIKVDLPRPKRGPNFSKDFFETNQILRRSPKYLVIRKFAESKTTVFDKYKNELIEEAEKCLKAQSETEVLLSPRSVTDTADFSEVPSDTDLTNKGKQVNLKLQIDASVGDDTISSKPNPTFDESPSTSKTSSKLNLVESKSAASSPRPKSNLGVTDDQIMTEAESNTLTNVTEKKSTDNPANVVLTRPEYYMHPPLKDLHKYMNENGECIVRGLTIGRRGYGNVHFSDPIDISNMNFDELVHFRYREIIVYPDDDNKPPFGEGLNRPAQVTLDKVYPRAKGTTDCVTDIDAILDSDFIDNLIKVTQKHDCNFVDYRPKTGSWVFRVKHFSKYGFSESDAGECEIPYYSKNPKRPKISFSRPEKEEDVPVIGLGGISEPISTPCLQELQEPENFWPVEENITEDLYHTQSAIQPLKASLFTNIATDEEILACYGFTSTYNPYDVITPEPKVYTLPDISSIILSQKVTTTQRCYTEIGIFKCDTYKVGWGKVLSFYNFDPMADNEVIYALTHYNIDATNYDQKASPMPSLTEMLKITLEESEFLFEPDGMPTLRIKRGLHYLQRQTKLFNDHATKLSLTGKDRYLCSIWNLCSALWGPGDDNSCMRRQYLSDWLKNCVSDLSPKFNVDEGRNLDDTKAFKRIFKLLSVYKVTEACEVATTNNLSRLSLLISQMSTNERVKFWMKKYVEYFAWTEDIIVKEFKKLYLLLSGIPARDYVNTCENLDWMRCFGVHLWYIAPAAAPIYVAVSMYKKAFEEFEYAAKPVPPYCDSDADTTHYDLLYQILSLYVDSTYQLCNALYPETHTDNIMDYRLSWFMLQLFLSLNVGLVRESEKDYFHTTFASQLENMGYWKWSVFCLLFLENRVLKKNLIRKILEQNLSVFSETEEIEKELVNTFRIPSAFIHEVKATKAKAADCYFDYFMHYFLMKDYLKAHEAFISVILPDLFLNEQNECIRNFIQKLQPYSRRLLNWDAEIGIIEDFMDVREKLSYAETPMSYFVWKLSAIFQRLRFFPIDNVKQRVCIAEISRQCALLFATVHRDLDAKTISDNINALVMPSENYHHQLMQFISEYVQS